MTVVRHNVIRAGFSPARMVQNTARGRAHDPRKVISVEVTLAGTAEELLSRAALEVAREEARRHGVLGGWARRKNDPHIEWGQMVATYTVE